MADFSTWVEQHKALWTRTFDEVIAPDLEEKWKEREQAHEKGLKAKEENQQILFNHLNEEILKVARLTKENEQLRGEIQRSSENVRTTLNGNHVDCENLTKLQEDLRLLTQKHEELARKYQDVSQKAKYMEKKNQSVMQKNKDMKESVRAWQEYADRQSAKPKFKTEERGEEAHLQPNTAYQLQDNCPHVPSSPGSIATVRTPVASADPGRSSPAPMVLLPPSVDQSVEPTIGNSKTPMSTHKKSGSFCNSTTPKQKRHFNYEESHHGIDVCSRPSSTYAYLQPSHPSSSQTTVDEPAERTSGPENDMEAKSNDDAPQFVSERVLKRKRCQAPKSGFEIYADPSSNGTSAQPYRVKEEPQSSPPTSASTLLLRKETFDLDELGPHLTRNHVSNYSSSTGTFHHHQRASTAPFSQNIEGENSKQRNPTELSTSHVSKSDGKGSQFCFASIEDRAHSEPSGLVQPGQAALQSLDPNLPTSVSEEPSSKRRRRSGRLKVVENDRLAKCSEKPETSIKSSLQTPKSKRTKIKAEETPTPSTNVFRSKQAARDDPASGERQLWTMKASDPCKGARNARVMHPKPPGRLRDRAHTELSIQDFKPNPAYNQGYRYAFSETVRKRDDRMCLPGCTNLQCCGSAFRTLAEAQAPLPASQEEALLKDYLGEAYDKMEVPAMPGEERQELVLQARTKKMANASGKHREAYERRKTPPGFWRVDFPSTQEQQQDRAKAKEMERREVQERWLEAQRKGGKWVFSDE